MSHPDGMRLFRPPRVLAGFHADAPSAACPELVHCGEQWLPALRHIGDHDHPVWEFYLQLEGATAWRCGREVHELRTGDLLGVPPGVVHGMPSRPAEPYHFFFAGIDVAGLLAKRRELAASWHERGTLYASGAEHLRDPFRHLMQEVRLDQPYRDAGLRCALDHLLLAFSRLVTAGSGKAWATLHPAVEEAKRLLELHCERAWSVAELGQQVGLSPNHLSQLFTRELGVAPHRYLLRQRIEQAQHLLRDTDRSISEIAIDLGFASSQHFARVFQRQAGCTASAFRSRYAS
jgi:AraC family transcriptional regulator